MTSHPIIVLVLASLVGCMDVSAVRKQADAYAERSNTKILGCRQSLWQGLDCDLPGYRQISCDETGCLESIRRCVR